MSGWFYRDVQLDQTRKAEEVSIKTVSRIETPSGFQLNARPVH
jgi:hypothetical protein